MRAVTTASADGRLTVVGTVREINDETKLDGPVRLVLIDAEGRPKKLLFGSLFTKPEPSGHRKNTYRAIAAARPGDCVQASGIISNDGQISVEDFVKLE